MTIKSKLILIIAAVSAMSAGYWLSTLQQNSNTTDATFDQQSKKMTPEEELAAARKSFSPIQGIILQPARKIAIPALTKDDGDVFTSADLNGHWSLLFFGYTHCPDICPITMGAVAQAKKIATANGNIFPEVIFISIDPERDKIELLAEYVQYFDKDFSGVTGDKDLIKALTLQMSVVYMKMPANDFSGKSGDDDSGAGKSRAEESEVSESEDGSGGYTMDHSSALLLLNPEGRLAAFLNPPHDPTIITKDIQTVIDLKQ